MAERLNAHDSKSCYAGMYTRVQIPFSAPGNERLVAFCYKPFLLQKSPNTILGLPLESGVYRKLHAFLPFELVHDVRIKEIITAA